MNAFQEYNDLSEEWGLGSRYFILVGAILAVLMTWLFVWGSRDVEQSPPAAVESARPNPS